MRRSQELLDQIRRIVSGDGRDAGHYILCIDIAGFMAVNRLYGSEAGDVLLDELCSYLEHLPEAALCRRLFSDHFLALVRMGADQTEEELLTQISGQLEIFLNEQVCRYPACRLRIACGLCRVETDELEDCIDLANLARKSAKEQGAEVPVLFGLEQRESLAARFVREQTINLALRENRFTFYLQPKVSLRTGEVRGAEALARRKDADGKVVFPDGFLQSMEESGSVVELDLLICRKVCEYLAQRLAKGLPVVCTSVNLSRLHIRRPGAAEQFHAIASENSIPPDLLEFELTETVFREDPRLAKRFINSLRAYGYRVSVDDFGHVSADVNIWQEMDFDSLKLDGRFLSDDPGWKERNEALVPNLINMAHRMNTAVLCEGVETEEQCQYLLRLGCSQVQGYYFSGAVPPDQFYDWYETNDGRYELSFQRQEQTKSTEPPRSFKPRWKENMSIRWNCLVASVLLIVVLLGAVGYVLFSDYREVTQKVISRQVIAEMDNYAVVQRGWVQSRLDDVTDALDAAAAVAGQALDEAVDSYLDVLNGAQNNVRYSYATAEEIDAMLASGTLTGEAAQMVEALRAGEDVVGPIVVNDEEGGRHEITCAHPVFRDGAFLGALRGTVDAGILVELPAEIQMERGLEWSAVTDGEGNILPVDERTAQWEPNLLDYLRSLERFHLDDGVLAGIEKAVTGESSKPQSWFVGSQDGGNYYISVISLEYSDWHYVACVRAERAMELLAALRDRMALGITALTITVIAAVLIAFFLLRQARRVSPDQRRRYFLLEQFSGLALFDYDCRRDIMRTTPNVRSFMRIHALEQQGFLKGLDSKHLYAGDMDEFYQMLSGALPSEGQVRVRLLRPDQEIYFWALVEYRYQYEGGRLASIIGKISDIDDKEQKEKSLVRLAQTDGLTGLYNKRSTEEKIIQQLAASDRGALVMFDIDDFKDINDDLGHDVGDRALRAVGEGLSRQFRRDDVVGRIGGDEFIAFLTGVNDRQLVSRKVGQMVEDVRRSVDLSGKVFSVSVGVAFYPRDGSSYPTLFKSADTAMYEAKRGGKQCCFFFGDIPQKQEE